MTLKQLGYLFIFCFMVIVPLTGLSFYVYSNDPYWIFHKKPEWVKLTNGHNGVLDARHCFAKTLQVVAYRPDIILMGSSRVYRGIPTDKDLFQNRRVYNFGVSMMQIREIHTYLVHVLRWTDVQEVIIGLDFFMFDSSNQLKECFDESISDKTYLFPALLTSLISKRAYDDIQKVNTGKQDNDGYWTRSGFKSSNPRDGTRIEEILRNSCNGRNPVTNAEYELFRKTLNLLSEKKIKTSIFISPLNNRMVAKMKKEGQYGGFLQWKIRISSIASEYGIFVHDFSENNPFFNNYPEGGSNRDWIDSTHYSPSSGRWIIKTIEQNNTGRRIISPKSRQAMDRSNVNQ